jgi:tight adherence protein C
MSEFLVTDGTGLLLAIAAALSGAWVIASIGFVVVDRIGLRTKLRGIDDLYNLVDLRDEELMLPFKDRIAAPVLKLLSRLGHRFSPTGRVDEMRSMLARAGRSDADTDRYLAIRVLSMIASPFAAYGGWTVGAGRGILQPVCAGLGFACCTIVPSRRLRVQVESRETLIRRQLPDIMDLLIICMEAGLGFTSAMSRTVANIDGEVSDEFARVLGEMRAGATRGDALTHLANRVQLPEVRSFVLAIRQADQFGISVSTVLRNQAEDMRVARSQLAQEKAMKAPVKMLIPMVFCIFPPMFIVVIGPAALNMSASGGF